jgi:hypothetical protein
MLAAADLVTWARLIGFGDQPALARVDPTWLRLVRTAAADFGECFAEVVW